MMNGTSSEMATLSNETNILFYTPVECRVVGGYLILMSLLGTLGNLVVTSVYGMKPNKCPYEMFMLCVSAVNLLGSCLFMPSEISLVWLSREDCNNPSDWFILVTMVLECSSSLLFLDIAFDRYFAICWPTSQVISPRIATGMIVASLAMSLASASVSLLDPKLATLHAIYPIVQLFVLGVIVGLYVAVILRVTRQANKNMGGDTAVSLTTEAVTATRGRSPRSFRTKLSVFGFNKKANRQREETELSTNGSAIRKKNVMEEMRNKTAKILICVTLVYIVCFVPVSTINLLFFLDNEFKLGLNIMHASESMAAVIKICQLCYYINFAASPAVYAFLSQRFREDFKVIILRKPATPAGGRSRATQRTTAA